MAKKPAQVLTVTGVHNRGTMEVPYGFIYFSDDTRLGFAPGQAGTMNVRSKEWHGLFDSNWDGTTERHFELAKEYFDNNSYRSVVIHSTHFATRKV